MRPFHSLPRAAASIALIGIVGAGTAGAQPTPAPPAGEARFSGGTILTDQDLWADWLDVNSDRNYTMGIGIAFHGRFVRSLPNLWVHDLVDHGTSRILGLLGLDPIHPRTTPGTGIEERSFHTIMLAGSGFTPDDLTAPTPILEDRPYGSIVALATRRTFVRSTPDLESAVSTELGWGIIGSSIAGDIQTWIHAHNSSPEPEGWDLEISDGGDPAVYYRVNWKRRLSPYTDIGAYKWWDFAWDVETYLGYYTNIASSLTLRVGRFFSQYYEFGSSPLGAVAQGVGGQPSSPPGSLFFFGSVQPRLVGYNALLQGWLEDDNAHEFDASQIERCVLELRAGVHGMLRLRGQTYLAATYMLTKRSQEFDTSLSRAHWYGSLNVGLIRPVF